MRIHSVIVLALVTAAGAFNGISNWKLPSISGFAQNKEATKKFGDKKLVIVTGASSGLGRKTARALLRTGK